MPIWKPLLTISRFCFRYAITEYPFSIPLAGNSGATNSNGEFKILHVFPHS